LLDDFRSDNPDDYIGGFPPHPHRGFETVTYLLHGRMRHGDSAGHSGVIEAGGVQWMTAGRGIIHSEMPEQEKGLLAGFQLWVNLPAEHKMMAPRYQEFSAAQIPVETWAPGVSLKVIAGTTSRGTSGVVSQLVRPVLYLDISLAAEASLDEPLDPAHHGCVYLYEGEIEIGTRPMEARALARLGAGDRLAITALRPSRLLLICGQPLAEPIARSGPFVMNTQAELQQAYSQYRNGSFA
jgi:redox-sensitive bicupin YhaK (pirin superfamily)